MHMLCVRCGREIAGTRCDACDPAPAVPLPDAPPHAKAVRQVAVRRRLPGQKPPFNWKFTLVSIAAAVVITLGVLLVVSMVARARMEGQGFFDRTVTLAPGESTGRIVVRLLSSAYFFEVLPEGGPVVMAVGELDEGESQEIKPADIERVMGGAVLVQPGEGKTLTGNMYRGRYLWVVANPSKDRPVVVTIRFMQ
jgi:hypothetical protein